MTVRQDPKRSAVATAAVCVALTLMAGIASASSRLVPMTLPAMPGQTDLPQRQPASARHTLLPKESRASQRQARPVYDLRSGESLRTALQRWCEITGWQLVWNAGSDYQVDTNMSFPKGTQLEGAVWTTVKSVSQVSPTLLARAYENNVLVIEGRN